MSRRRRLALATGREPAGDRVVAAPHPDREPRWAARLAGPLVLATGFVALAAWSWRKWPDLLVDFGHELYLPWQLADGKVLYHDLATLYGPLSQYANALLFAIFGVSLRTLVLANLVLLAVLTALLYRLLCDACDRLTALAACGLLLGIFAFSQYTGVGNYDFVCPYSHEATHGTLLGVLVVAALARAARDPRRTAPWLLAGFSLGLCALTRVESAAAAAAATVTALALLAATRAARVGRPALLLLASAGVPLAASFALLATALPRGAALRGTFGAWVPLFESSITRLPFFASLMGIDHPWANAAGMLVRFLALAAAAAAVAFADVLGRRRGLGSGAAAATGAALFVVLVAFPQLVPSPLIWGSLPLVVLCTGAALVAVSLRRGDAAPLAGLAAFSVFALAMLGKILLSPRIAGYGFYLAMPGALVAAAALVWGIPSLLRARYRGGSLFRAAALGMLGALVVSHVRWSDGFFRQKTLVVGTGGDEILAYGPDATQRGVVFAQALRRVEELMRKADTFAALPEGVMLNYLSRRTNPTPFTTFNPTEASVFGEGALASALAVHPPDYVLLVDKDTSEFGVGRFGEDPAYGQAALAFVSERYDELEVIGDRPFSGAGFGIAILKRKAPR